MASVCLRNIGMTFQTTTALADVSLDVEEGEFLSLVGPSGCGKSTLLRIIAGLELQSEGSVDIAGRCVDNLRPKQRDIAMVFQSYALYPYATVEHNIGMPLKMARTHALQRLPLIGRVWPGASAIRKVIAEDVLRVAQSLEIDHLLHRKPGQLSGGQRQRVALGRAIVRNPRIFLMDEPLSNLDAKMRVKMRAEIMRLHRKLGTTFIYVTHDQAEALTMSDRVAVMMNGRLLQVGTPQDVYVRPDTLDVALFIGSPQINVLAGAVKSERELLVGDLCLPFATTLAARSPVSIGVRPEHARLTAFDQSPDLSGTVSSIEHHGSDLYVSVKVADATDEFVVRASPAEQSGFALDEPVGIVIDRNAIHVFDADRRRIARAPSQKLESVA
jgi:multiple sugar transport system ATP-binding protein